MSQSLPIGEILNPNYLSHDQDASRREVGLTLERLKSLDCLPDCRVTAAKVTPYGILCYMGENPGTENGVRISRGDLSMLEEALGQGNLRDFSSALFGIDPSHQVPFIHLLYPEPSPYSLETLANLWRRENRPSLTCLQPERLRSFAPPSLPLGLTITGEPFIVELGSQIHNILITGDDQCGKNSLLEMMALGQAQTQHPRENLVIDASMTERVGVVDDGQQKTIPVYGGPLASAKLRGIVGRLARATTLFVKDVRQLPDDGLNMLKTIIESGPTSPVNVVATDEDLVTLPTIFDDYTLAVMSPTTKGIQEAIEGAGLSKQVNELYPKDDFVAVHPTVPRLDRLFVGTGIRFTPPTLGMSEDNFLL